MSEEEQIYAPEENVDGFPDGVPSIVAAGFYLCRFKKSCTAKTSQYDPSQHYFDMPLRIRDTDGNEFDFSFNFQPKSQIFIEIMKLQGATELPSGIVKPPKNSIMGKYFMAEITQRQARNDKNKIVNDVVKVWAYEPEKVKKETISKELRENEEEFPKEKEEEIPF